MLNVFDSGTLFFIPADGDLTPVRVGGLQDIQLEADFDLRRVQGQLKFPLKFTTGLASLKAKAKFAKIDGDLLFRVAFGGTSVTGSRQVNLDEPRTVPASPFQLTFSPPGVGSTFAFDLGVIKVSDGLPVARVVAGPVGFQYMVTPTITGATYTFGSACNGLPVRVSYAFDSLSGKKLVLQNQPQWLAPNFGVMLYQTFKCGKVSFWLPAVVSEKLLWPSKLEDYTIPGLEFEAQQDSSGEVGTFSVVDP